MSNLTRAYAETIAKYRMALERIAAARDIPFGNEPEADVLSAIACKALGQDISWLDGLAKKWYEESRDLKWQE